MSDDFNYLIPESDAAAPPVNRRGFWGAVGFFLHALAAGSFFSCRRPEPERKMVDEVLGWRYVEMPRQPVGLDSIKGFVVGRRQALVKHEDGELEWVDVSECD